MKFIHQREHLNEDDIVVIQCSQMCNKIGRAHV